MQLEDAAGGDSRQIAEALPYLRRHARALSGSQSAGDAYAAETLEAILADRTSLDPALSPRIALFRAFHRIWAGDGALMGRPAEGTLQERAERHMARLTPRSREALLLNTIEECGVEDIAAVMDTTASEAKRLVDTALAEMRTTVRGTLIIIEDEGVIAMDIRNVATDMGHEVLGIARTHEQAVTLAQKSPPQLILADIQLADDSSGIEAVNEILRKMADIPVIFITAYPERLLHGNRPEPAFLITKPYTDAQVRSAISQAMFFSSTDPLMK
ncbi:response regulator [Roseovarius tibetensis]|uniref:response regulator n=1 Tax=Roseovarius tibetensis TaxID=2685897 RepID=UPI003D7FC2DC